MGGAKGRMKRETIHRQRQLEAEGWALKSEKINQVAPHTGFESLKHYHLKAEIARQASNKTCGFITEAALGDASVDADYADVLLLRESTHEKGIVVELESNFTEEKKRKKINQYLTPTIQEVLVWNPQDAPDSLDGLNEWVGKHLKGFI